MKSSIMYREVLEKKPWVINYDPEVELEPRYPTYMFQELLQSVATRHPNKEAIWFYGTTFTYWELFQTKNRFAHALINMGIKKGDRIGLHVPNSPQFNFAYWGGLSAGATIVNLNVLCTADELEYMAKHTGLSAIVTFSNAIPTVEALTKRVEITHVIVTAINDYIPGQSKSSAESLGIKEKGWHHFEDVIKSTEKFFVPRVDLSADDAAVIQFTGGTTGFPKGVTLSHGNLVPGIYIYAGQSATILQDIPVERRRVLCILPYTHVFGQLGQMAWSVKHVCTQVILPKFDPDEAINTIDKFDEFMFFGCVPTMINALVHHPRAKEVDLGKKLTFIGCGGAPCPPDLIEKLRDLNIYFVEGWGMSETCSTGITTPVMGKKKLGSIGVPAAGVEIRLIDPVTGEDVMNEPHKVGELVIKSPLVMKGYWNNEEETAKVLKDGWLYTGDMGYRDEDWYFFLVDRTKDMIISGGFNVYPNEVDKIIFGHPKVYDVITFGIPDDHWGEKLKACVVLNPGEKCTEEEIISWCKEKLSAYKIPKSVEFRDTVPRTPVGKALRRVLRDEEAQKQKS